MAIVIMNHRLSIVDYIIVGIYYTLCYTSIHVMGIIDILQINSTIKLLNKNDMYLFKLNMRI